MHLRASARRIRAPHMCQNQVFFDVFVKMIWGMRGRGEGGRRPESPICVLQIERWDIHLSNVFFL